MEEGGEGLNYVKIVERMRESFLDEEEMTHTEKETSCGETD